MGTSPCNTQAVELKIVLVPRWFVRLLAITTICAKHSACILWLVHRHWNVAECKRYHCSVRNWGARRYAIYEPSHQGKKYTYTMERRNMLQVQVNHFRFCHTWQNGTRTCLCSMNVSHSPTEGAMGFSAWSLWVRPTSVALKSTVTL